MYHIVNHIIGSAELCATLSVLCGFHNSKIVRHVASVNMGFCVLSCNVSEGVDFKLVLPGARLYMCSMQAWNCVPWGIHMLTRN